MEKVWQPERPLSSTIWAPAMAIWILSLSSFSHPTMKFHSFSVAYFIGGAAGTCFIIAHQLLFVTQLFLLIGGNQYHLLNLRDIEYWACSNSTSHQLCHHPVSWSQWCYGTLQTEIIKFIPSIDAQSFKDLMQLLIEVLLLSLLWALGGEEVLVLSF